ncbi:TrkH family potassium uptake protein [Hungatella effluvii]|jgi:trk system potassium uptake protein TrkH|uniref:TrkH family potassium uptake protein n=1 Tax=Hungatella effluvii TaxID=1096246 RepID=UPI002A7F18DB|nr:TrkH family potassium uptake protein [Hungatella effluvii]
MDEKKLIHARRHVSQTQFIAYGFFCVIITGTLLLMLPFASRDGQSEPFLNCLFTATSASCVTGLVVADTWSQWSLFGQLVILTMIQIGGLGFITVGVFISIVLRRKIGLKERGLMMESVNTLQIGGVVRLAKKIIIGTCIFEGMGAVLLAIRFIPQFGFFRGLFYGIFHSISAFCNAGFDLMGGQTPYSSFVAYYDDWLVNFVIMSLIIIGGIGFIVWDDLSRNKLHFRKYMLQTKIVLVTTAILVFGGGLLFYLLERNHLLVGMNTSGKILTSLFSSVTARTAGFNTTDTAALTDGSKLLTIILMFIGGSPGSTAGGIKTTTLVVLLLCVHSNIKQTYGINIFGRRLENDAVKRAGTILTINLLLAVTASLAIMAIQPLGFSDILFETFSAIGTVGMTTGITRALHPVSRCIIILLMYCGRIGSLSFALAFVQSKRKPHVQQPAEAINIG